MTLPVRPPASAAVQQALAGAGRRRRAGRRSARVACREEQPGEGEVLELAQVVEVVVGRQAPLARPAERLGEPSLRDPDPRPQRRDRAHVRERSRRRSAARPRRAASSAPSRSPSACRSRAIATRQRYGFCGRPACSPSSRLLREVLRRGRRGRRARGGARSCPTCMSAVPRRTGSPVPVGELQRPARRCASPRARRPCATPDVGQGDRAAEHVGDVAGPLQAAPWRRRTTRCAASRSPLVQDASPSRAGAAARPRWSSSPARSSARSGVGHRARRRRRGASASPARYSAIAPADARNASSSTTTIPVASVACRRDVASSHRSASRRRGLDALDLAAGQQRPRRTRR